MDKPITARDVIEVVDAFAPPALAEPEDPIGLQLGRYDRPVSRVLVALEPSPQVVAYAVEGRFDMVITHHAMIYRGTRSIDTSTARGRAIAQALSTDMTIYTAHTNLDAAEGGVNDVLADRFGLTNLEVLERHVNDDLKKLVVFVPETHHQQVRDAVCRAGAGHIGGYSHCTFNTPGVGTFLPQEGANPYIGQVGRLEETREVRLETIVPASLVEPVVRAMLAAHPYEEVAYDLYPLDIMGKAYGIGRIGALTASVALDYFANQVRQALGLPHIRWSGDAGKQVSRVAVVGGAGGDFIRAAIAKGADVLVTSDVDHHDVAEAWQDGLAIIDATHAALERPVLPVLRHRIEAGLQAGSQPVYIEVCPLNEDPFHWS